jgi:hypothetical protein
MAVTYELKAEWDADQNYCTITMARSPLAKIKLEIIATWPCVAMFCNSVFDLPSPALISGPKVPVQIAKPSQPTTNSQFVFMFLRLRAK